MAATDWRQPCRSLARRRRQPVLVLPGFSAGDGSTLAIRADLARRGHPVHGWGLGRNVGPTESIITGLRSRFADLVERYDTPVALVGWSLGGVYAWSLANRNPDQVRSIVTLGSPLRSTGIGHPPAPIPVTSIWSRWDNVVASADSTIEAGPRAENIEVRATHLTLGVDPFVLAAVADRMASDGRDWAPFRPNWPFTAAYPDRVAAAAAA